MSDDPCKDGHNDQAIDADGDDCCDTCGTKL